MKALTIIIGLILIAVGVYLCFPKLWGAHVLALIEGAVPLGLIVVGLGAFFFGVSEVRSAAEEARTTAPAPPPPPEGQKPPA